MHNRFTDKKKKWIALFLIFEIRIFIFGQNGQYHILFKNKLNKAIEINKVDYFKHIMSIFTSIVSLRFKKPFIFVFNLYFIFILIFLILIQ